MDARVDTGKLNMAAELLLDTSRVVRRLREEVEEVRRQLRQLSQLDECRAALVRQEEALSLVSGGMVNLSAGIQQVSDAYRMTETRNTDILEEAERPLREPANIILCGPDSGLQQKIDQILYK